MIIGNFIEEARFGGPQNRMIIVGSRLTPLIKTIVCMPRENNTLFESKCRNQGMPVITFFAPRLANNLRSFGCYVFYFPFVVSHLMQIIRTQRFNLIHCSGGVTNVRVLLSGILCRKKVVLHLNDTCSPMVFRMVLKLLSPKLAGIIFASHRAKEYYQRYLPTELTSDVIQALVTPPKRKLSYDLNGQRLRCVTVGNISRVKGFHYLISLIQDLSAREMDVEIVVLGEVFASQKRYFEQCISGLVASDRARLKVLGRSENIIDILSEFDIYLCTSESEASPMAVWEAMFAGLPIVSFDVGDFALVSQSSDYIFPVGDILGMAKAVEELGADVQAREQAGKHNFVQACETLSSDTIIAKYHAFYRKVMEI